MKKLIISVLVLVNSLLCFSQTNTLQLEDTNLITSQRWRDTCFALLDKCATQIPSGYLIDYSLAPLNDNSFNGANIKNNTITES